MLIVVIALSMDAATVEPPDGDVYEGFKVAMKVLTSVKTMFPVTVRLAPGDKRNNPSALAYTKDGEEMAALKSPVKYPPPMVRGLLSILVIEALLNVK